ncbi:MAG: hypothetical protein Q9169_008058 [Polycauliona sp. 2 TL-2023]
METLAIIGCIAAVVSAYRDGGIIVDKIKQKRLARQAPPPPRLLEDSLARGPRAVDEAKETGIERFGDRYADKLALDSLKDILIDLQASLIRHLRQAQDDDHMSDFTPLIDASDLGRIRTVTVLNELYVRVAMGTTATQKPLGDTVCSTPPQAPATAAPAVVTQVIATSPASPSNARIIQPSLPAYAGTPEQPREPKNNAKSAFFDIFRRKSSSDDGSAPSSSRRSSKISAKTDVPRHTDGREGSQSLPAMASPQATIDEDEENPWATEDTQTSASTTVGEILPNDSFSRAATLVSNSQQKPQPRHWPSPTPTTKMLSPDDPYGGFCKGAYKMQIQEKDAMKLRNLPVPKTGGNHYLACVSLGKHWSCCSSQCAYDGPAHPVGLKSWAMDDTVRKACGVRYRWSFLAKAHVASPESKDGRYDYGCVFCFYDGYECQVFNGIRNFMAHIGEHRGKPIAETMLQRFKCITDRTATAEEEFDVNLTPLEIQPHATFENAGQSAQHSLLSAAASDRVSWTPDDETAHVDPWRDVV